MKIIIVGNGKVGYAIAGSWRWRITTSPSWMTTPQPCTGPTAPWTSCAWRATGASISVLDAAGVRGADLVIAVTNLDETNLVCCLIAKSGGPRHHRPGTQPRVSPG